MSDSADYPGFPEPEPEPEKRHQQATSLRAFLEQIFLDVMTGFLDLVRAIAGAFIGAMFALELSRAFSGEPPIDGMYPFYIAFGLVYVIFYAWKTGTDRIRSSMS